jgi:hypothetical protein
MEKIIKKIDKSSEYEFALLMSFVIYHFCDKEVKVDYKKWKEFYEEQHSLERIDKDGYSIYKVT